MSYSQFCAQVFAAKPGDFLPASWLLPSRIAAQRAGRTKAMTYGDLAAMIRDVDQNPLAHLVAKPMPSGTTSTDEHARAKAQDAQRRLAQWAHGSKLVAELMPSAAENIEQPEPAEQPAEPLTANPESAAAGSEVAQ